MSDFKEKEDFLNAIIHEVYIFISKLTILNPFIKFKFPA